ncbi:HEPN domain-containing protein [Ruegeria lacuscaerulensis]|uniref:HEPN domain-containing protein n=1 Tax=Ruegeria lacuscaerulensis TaxID=55218 RepID=UPI00147CF42C|nr:HEPN domain-containing protein [Ruegeria lacuscaerulensis]
MKTMTYSTGTWCARLAAALQCLEKVQRPFLEKYWQTNSYPEQISFNGKDETPFPKDDLCEVYDLARRAIQSSEIKFYEPLRSALDPVRGILRSHPALGRALGPVIGNDEFRTTILNGSSLTWLSRLICGLMERANEEHISGFETASAELGALLDLSTHTLKTNIPNNLNIGFDLLLFHGPRIDAEIDLQDGLFIKPAADLRNFLEVEWLRDFVPENIDHRDWRQIGAVVRPFRWRPAFERKTDFYDRPPIWPVEFEADAFEFIDLLAVANQTPIIPFVLLRGCIHRTACNLLGVRQSHGGIHPCRLVGKRYDPFRSPPKLHKSAVHQAMKVYKSRENVDQIRLSAVVRRLSEALARDGRFGADDRILDVSQSIELMFEIKGTGIGKKLQKAMVDLLALDEEHAEEVRNAVKHFYDVRSAIVHGASDAYRKRLLEGRQRAFRSGFNLAKQAYFKLVLEGVTKE